MRLIALLSWYDEDPGWLAESVACLAGVGADHVVAVDGAYALYPQGKPRSSTDQAAAVLHTAHGCGMSCTIHTPPVSWAGNEIEKRTFMFRCGDLVAEEGDWFMPMDADQFVAGHGLKEALDATDLDAGEVMFTERLTEIPHGSTLLEQSVTRFMCRILFRAIPGIVVQHNHYTYVAPDGRWLWNGNHGRHIEAAELPYVTVEHRTNRRAAWQQHAKHQYWDRRTRFGVEEFVNGAS